MDEHRQNQHPVEDNVYSGVYHVLLGGMVVSTALYVIGLIRGMMLHTFFPLTQEWVKQHYEWAFVKQGIMTLEPTTLMMLATIILILTPVARVMVSIYAFAVDRDKKYVLVTSTVLAIMVLTFVLSRFGLQ